MKFFISNLKKSIFLLIGILILVSCETLMTSKSNRGSSSHLIPIKRFFKNAESKSYKLSPNGKYLAYLKSYKNRMHIFVKALSEPSLEKRITNKLERNVALVGWKGNNTLLFLKDPHKDENFHLYSVVIEFKEENEVVYEEKDLTPYSDETEIRFISYLQGTDPSHVLIASNQRDKRFFDLYKLNIKTGKTILMIKNTFQFDVYLSNKSGDSFLTMSRGVAGASLFYRKNEKDNFQKILTVGPYESFEPLAFTSSDKKIYALSNLGKRDKMALVEWDLINRRETRELFSHSKVDVGYPWTSLGLSRRDQKLLYVNYNTWKQNYHFFDLNFESYFKNISSHFEKEDEIRFISSNENEDLLLIRVISDRSPGAYYLYNTIKNQLTFLAKSCPWINESKMARTQPINYKSRDGLKIHGYLTLPLWRSSSKNLPAIILPHGGPWWRDLWGFNSEVQFFANQGFVVLQMDFRGSIGYGKRFWKASFKQRGLKMQDDVTDGVQWLIKKGIADPERIGIYGKSYGGFVTLAGLAFTPDLYKVGVSYGGVSNLFTSINLIPPSLEHYRELIYKTIGHPEKDKELLKKASPFFHVHRIKAPLFIAHGENDRTVRKLESDQIVKALRKQGKEVIYKLQKGEGHSFRDEENRLEFYEHIREFFSKHLLH